MADRAVNLARVARAFADWETANLDDAPFNPDGATRDPSDYNEHHLTVDATPAQDAELRARVERALQ